ncbi:MAG: inorganic phosphate transporter [Chloroflexi bacterium]|nr:inorganic phosphate transporter [Chloroflexota bacterium]
MDGALAIVYVVIILGLAFEFVNGFHDAANAIATVVATRVLSPRAAVLMAGSLNFLGALSGTAVATTLGKGIVDPLAISQTTVAIALVSAIAWDLLTWYYGLPTSSSHALVFSVLGAAVATAGFKAVIWSGTSKTLLGIVYSPLLGLLFGAFLMLAIYWLFRDIRASVVSAFFGRAQLVSSAYMAFSHGGNDGQKTMGIISLALFSAGLLGSEFHVPLWVMIGAAAAMGLGTAMGGWRIIRTMGRRLVRLAPVNGFAAETAAGTVIEIATRFGIPISTTHAISSAILGVGATRGTKSVRWQVAGNILMAWVLTIPCCFALGYLLTSLVRMLVDAGVAIPGVG